MKILDVEQGSQAWIDARLGIPTASNFHRILTPGGKRSDGQQKYLLQLLAEWCSGHQTDDEAMNDFMARGREQEKRAAAYYECETDTVLERVGLILRDDGLVGCSPDRLVIGKPGLVELKVPKLETHLSYLLGGDMNKYAPQAQGQLWLAERAWADLVSYNGTQPSTILRYERDEEFIKVLANEVDRFLGAVANAKDRLRGMGVVPLVQAEARGDLTAALGDVLA